MESGCHVVCPRGNSIPMVPFRRGLRSASARGTIVSSATSGAFSFLSLFFFVCEGRRPVFEGVLMWAELSRGGLAYVGISARGGIFA